MPRIHLADEHVGQAGLEIEWTSPESRSQRS
jgi:hypothetical protein